jgi:hypothetical protein
MNNDNRLEKLQPAALTDEQRQRFITMIDAIFKSAIDARSPKKRPPGKAGLRAEKGYYRLLYLEGDFHETVRSREEAGPEALPDNWGNLSEIIRQLTDMPELRSEILARIKSALEEIISPPSP